MKKLYLLIFLSFIISNFSFGQLTVLPANSSTNKLEDIVKALVGTGVIVSNITSNMPVSTNIYGTFTEPSNPFKMNKGLLMTTGSIQNAIGPNDYFRKEIFLGNDGDASLTNLIQNETFDACVIEFDITTTSTRISFNYLFGSEEYPVFVNSLYNDVFAFFISGPGISGNKNLAIIPGTTLPVSINTLNDSEYASYYISNGDGETTGGPLLQYNGFTTKLTATSTVFPCQTYHLKLAIADGSDGGYDSGVFIESGSLKGSDNILIANIIAPDSLTVCSTDFPFPLTAGVSVLPNYAWSKNGTVVATGSKFHTVSTPGWYKVYAFGSPQCYWTDSILIKEDQAFALTTSNDTSICDGGLASLTVQPSGGSGKPYSYSWTPTNNLSTTTLPNTIATPLNTTSYSAVVKSGACTKTSTVRVSVIKKPTLVVSNSMKGCENKKTQLSATGASNYIWTPGINLNDSTISNPIATLATSTQFKVIGYNSCFKDSVNVLVTIHEFPPVKAYGDTTICFGGIANLNADYYSQYQYYWSPPNLVTNNSIPNPKTTLETSKAFYLLVNNNGCFITDTVTVLVKEKVVAEIDMPIKYYEIPWTVKLGNNSLGANNFEWDINGFKTLKSKEPTVVFKDEDYYAIRLKATNSLGCFDYDTVFVKTYKLFIPNLITPNGDNKNDNFEITGLGDYIMVQIYNQWGDRVYKKTNYRNEWDGEGLSDGVYFYVITDPIAFKELKGWVQIIR